MKLLKLLPILILSLLLACPGYAADGTIDDQTNLGAQPATDDTFPMWDASAGATKKVTYANMVDIRNADSYGGLTAAVTAIAGTKTTIIINSAQAVAADLSIPTTLSLICLQSADIVVASTKTLTVNGEIIAGDYQIFSGSGTTTINSKGFVNAKWTGGSRGSFTLADGNLLDLSSINGSSTTEGLKLPQGADVSASTAEGQITWDSDTDKLNIGTGTETIVISADSGALSGDILWDAAGDLVYGTGNNTATRLAKGAANTKLFINAGATAPEWAVGMKIGTFTRSTGDATGTQAISGVGFKPSVVIFLAVVHQAARMSIGIDNGTNHYGIADADALVATTWVAETATSISILQTPAYGDYYAGFISVMGSDGFTISWTKIGTVTQTITIFYLAFR